MTCMRWTMQPTYCFQDTWRDMTAVKAAVSCNNGLQQSPIYIGDGDCEPLDKYKDVTIDVEDYDETKWNKVHSDIKLSKVTVSNVLSVLGETTMESYMLTLPVKDLVSTINFEGETYDLRAYAHIHVGRAEHAVGELMSDSNGSIVFPHTKVGGNTKFSLEFPLKFTDEVSTKLLDLVLPLKCNNSAANGFDPETLGDICLAGEEPGDTVPSGVSEVASLYKALLGEVDFDFGTKWVFYEGGETVMPCTAGHQAIYTQVTTVNWGAFDIIQQAFPSLVEVFGNFREYQQIMEGTIIEGPQDICGMK